MSTRRTPNSPPEPNVAAVDAELPAQMRQVAERIRPFEVDAANRLIAIADQLPDARNANRYFDHLLSLDPYQIVNPNTIERRASDSALQQSTAFGCLETIRNMLVLVPILITWIALSIASHNYAESVTVFPDKAGAPFLLLWEQGFPAGTLTWLRFSWVAGADFAILAIIIILTVFFHYATEIQNQKPKRNALALRQDLDDVLWRLSKQFSQRRLLRAPDQGALEAATKMNETALTLETAITALSTDADSAAKRADVLNRLHQTFSQQQGELRAQLGSLHQQQLQLTAQVSTSVQQLDASTKEMRSDLERVSGELGQAVTSAKEAANAATEGLKLAQSAVSEAGKTATAVAGVEQQLGSVVGQLNGVTGTLGRTNQALENNVGEASKLNQGIQKATQEIDTVATKIDSVAVKIDAVASKIDALPANLQSISQSLQTSAQQTASTAQATAGLVQRLDTLVAQLPTIAQNMQSVAGSLNKTAQEMTQSVVESKSANQALQSAAQNLSQGAQQTAQAFAQNAHQTVQAFTQGTQQAAQAFAQGTQQTAQSFSQGTQQTAQVYAQGTQQTAQAFAQGVQQTTQAFSQNIVRPLVTEVDAIKAQLNYVHQVLASMPGVGQRSVSFWWRAGKWFAVLVLASLLLPSVILIPWFITQALWLAVIGLSVAVIVLAGLLAVTIAWQR